jgi:phosphohistidine phosphatase SixA
MAEDSALAGIELVICSPLTRAIQTTEIVFGQPERTIRKVVSPLISEVVHKQCDHGKELDQL